MWNPLEPLAFKTTKLLRLLSTSSRSSLLLPQRACGLETHVILTHNCSCHLQPYILWSSWMSACLEHALLDNFTIQKSLLNVIHKCWTLYPQKMTSTRLQWQVCPLLTISWLALPTSQPPWLPIPSPAPLSSGKSFILTRLGHLEDFLPWCPQEVCQSLQATGGMTTLDQLTKPAPTKPPAAMPDSLSLSTDEPQLWPQSRHDFYLNTSFA